MRSFPPFVLQVADVLLREVPDMTLATDIICGFPGETEQDHAQTLALLDHYRLPVVNISQFYPRPGTPAARMKRVPTHVVKERSREVSALFASYSTHAHLVGSTVQALVTDMASDKKHYVGHTKGYVQVLLQACDGLMGSTVLVRVTEAAKFYVRGEVMKCIHPPPRLSRVEGQVALHPKVKPLPAKADADARDLASQESGCDEGGCACGGDSSGNCGSDKCGNGDCGAGSCGEDGCGEGGCGGDCGSGRPEGSSSSCAKQGGDVDETGWRGAELRGAESTSAHEDGGRKDVGELHLGEDMGSVEVVLGSLSVQSRICTLSARLSRARQICHGACTSICTPLPPWLWPPVCLGALLLVVRTGWLPRISR